MPLKEIKIVKIIDELREELVENIKETGVARFGIPLIINSEPEPIAKPCLHNPD